MSDLSALLNTLENTRTKAIAKAHEDYASACETGMNDMIQAVRQAANPITKTQQSASVVPAMEVVE